MKVRLDEATRAEVESAAKAKGITMNAELRARVQSRPTAFPLATTALLELLGHVMTDAGQSICDTNALAGHERRVWLSDPYACDQAISAAMHVLNAIRPEGTTEPCGIFGSSDYPKERARKHGVLVAEGILAFMRGRYSDPDAKAAVWVERVGKQLGGIGDRLLHQPPLAEHFRARTTAPNPEEPNR